MGITKIEIRQAEGYAKDCNEMHTFEGKGLERRADARLLVIGESVEPGDGGWKTDIWVTLTTGRTIPMTSVKIGHDTDLTVRGLLESRLEFHGQGVFSPVEKRAAVRAEADAILAELRA